MRANHGSDANNSGRRGAPHTRPVRWRIDEKILCDWRNFTQGSGRPVQHEAEKAMALWMSLPPELRDRLDLRGLEVRG
jgi:hypothetical protein